VQEYKQASLPSPWPSRDVQSESGCNLDAETVILKVGRAVCYNHTVVKYAAHHPGVFHCACIQEPGHVHGVPQDGSDGVVRGTRAMDSMQADVGLG